MHEETLASESVVALSGADASAVAWRMAGQLFVTVVAKASFSLTPGEAMIRCEPQRVIASELHYGNNPVRSVRFTPDLAPRLDRADVLFTGHGHAPTPAPAALVAARLAVYAGERAVLDKTILLQDPRGFQRIPIVYERAFGGSTVLENPLGLGGDGDGDGGEPTIVDVINPKRPASFGPIARAWPTRKRLLGKTPRKVLEGAVAEIPSGFDWSYFQAAPPDQQIASLRGDETIVLGGLHPALPVFVARLPGVRGIARIHHLAGSGIPEGRALDLTLDTLRIDGDEERCTVVCRGAFEIPDEAALAEMLILAGIEVAGQASDWPFPLPTRRRRSPLERSPENVRAGTVLDTVSTPSSPPSQKSSPSLGGAAPDRTHVLGIDRESESTRVPFGSPGPEGARAFGASAASDPVETPDPVAMTLQLTPDKELSRLGKTLPFRRSSSARAAPAPAPGGVIPGAPWSHEPLASAPITAPGAMTMSLISSAASPASPPGSHPGSPVLPAVAPIPPVVSESSSQLPAENAPPLSHFFHDIRRMNEIDAAAPLEADAEVSLERCARITVELTEGRTSRIAILEAHGLTNARWTAAERGWQSAIEEEGKSGGHTLRDAFDTAYLAAWESIRGALRVSDYARLVLAAETGKLTPALDALAIRRTVWTRMKRRWDHRITIDPRLSAEVEREIAALRGA